MDGWPASPDDLPGLWKGNASPDRSLVEGHSAEDPAVIVIAGVEKRCFAEKAAGPPEIQQAETRDAIALLRAER